MKSSAKVIAGKGSKSKGNRSVCVPTSPNGYQSVSVRPIDNGFIISHSNDKGYSEVYSATKPKIEVPKAKK